MISTKAAIGLALVVRSVERSGQFLGSEYVISKNTLIHMMDNLVEDKGSVLEASYFVLNMFWFDFMYGLSTQNTLTGVKDMLQSYDNLWVSAVDSARDDAWEHWYWPDFLLMMLDRRGIVDGMIKTMIYEWGIAHCSDNVKQTMSGFSTN